MSDNRYFCCSPDCQGLPYRASERRHPCGWNADLDRKEPAAQGEHMENELLDMPTVRESLTLARQQRDKLADALRYIAKLGGNLFDESLTARTGPNDAVHRGLMYTEARRAALEALAATGETGSVEQLRQKLNKAGRL